MRRHSLLITLSFFFITSIYAQKITVDAEIIFGDLLLERSKDVTIVSAFNVEDGYIIFKKEPIKGPGGYHYFIEKFDKEMNSLRVHDVSRQFEDEKYIIDEIIKVGTSYVLITTKNDKERKKEELYAQVLDWESAKLGKRKLIYSQTYPKRRRRIGYDIVTSPNEKYLMFTLHPFYEKNVQEKLNFKVFDSDIEELWSLKDFEIESEDRNYSVREVVLADNGNIHILGKKYIEKDKKAGVEASSSYDKKRGH
ncbi:MAG: hypothetical protein JKY53_04910 [Flavobacteriales bacterium]|nr:hypothetical protein [Flavobacteriales bacterium]